MNVNGNDDYSQLNGKIKFMFQTTNQLLLFTANLVKLNRYTNNIPTYIHTSNMINIIQLHTLGLQFQWLMHKHSCRDHIPTYVFFWSHCEPQQHPQATAYLRIINTILQVYYYKLDIITTGSYPVQQCWWVLIHFLLSIDGSQPVSYPKRWLPMVSWIFGTQGVREQPIWGNCCSMSSYMVCGLFFAMLIPTVFLESFGIFYGIFWNLLEYFMEYLEDSYLWLEFPIDRDSWWYDPPKFFGYLIHPPFDHGKHGEIYTKMIMEPLENIGKWVPTSL